MDRNKLLEYLKSTFMNIPVEPMQTIGHVAKARELLQPTPKPTSSGLLGGDSATIGPANPAPTPPQQEMPVAPPPAPMAAVPAMPAPTPQLPQVAPSAPSPAPRPVQTMDGVLGPKYDDAARQRMLDMIAQRGERGLIGSAFAGFGDVMANAYGKGGQNTMDKTMQRSADTESGVKADFEAGRKGKMEEFAANQSLKKSGREDQEYADQNDPNSQQSKLSVGFAAKMLGADKIKELGWTPGKTSYADVAKVLPIIEKYVASENARADRRLKHSEKEDQFKDRQTAAFRNSIQTSGPYKTWSTLQNVRAAAEQAMKSPSPYGDVQLIYAAVKAFDPDSVVREGEIKLFQGAASIKEGMQAALSTAFSGKTLTPAQRADVMSILTNYDKTASAVLRQHIEPTRQQATRMGMRMEEIDPSLAQLDMQPQGDPAPADTKVIGGKQYKKVNGKWYAL